MKHSRNVNACRLTFFAHGSQNTVSPLILYHGELCVHCRINTLLGVFLFGMAEKGRAVADIQTAKSEMPSTGLLESRRANFYPGGEHLKK